MTISQKTTWMVQAMLMASQLGKREDGRFFLAIDFRQDLGRGAYVPFRRFYTLEGESLQFALRELKVLGLNGDLPSLHDQGIHNGSTSLSFGELFELELQTINGKTVVEKIRRIGGIQMKSALSADEARSALSGISTSMIEE